MLAGASAVKLGLRPLTRPRLGSSVRCFGLFSRPKRRLDGTGSFVLEVGEDAGPVEDAALRSRLSLLCFFEFAFRIAQTLTPGSVELWVLGQNGASTLDPLHTERFSWRY